MTRASGFPAILTLALVTACYSPTLEPACAVHCDFAAAGPCPNDFECLASGVCAPHGTSCATAPIDAAPPPDGPLCFGQPGGLFHACLAAPPTAGLATPSGASAQIDTDASCMDVVSQSASMASPVCLMAFSTIDLEGTTTVVGSRPLVLLAAGSATIGATGALDASSRGGAHGAGAFACTTGTAPTANGTASSGAGAGGSFQSAGGAGGGDQGQGLGGGTAGMTSTPTFVRGGCDGAPGYSRVLAALAQGSNGGGGGAVYVIAGTSIDVAGRIEASGGGGPIAANHTDCKDAIGGRGGGTGGLVGLDAPAITVEAGARVFAIGGGGSSGCNGGGMLSVAGADGASGGAGGAGSKINGAGGSGSVDTATGGSGGSGEDDGGGAGGGGGGAGFIWWASTSTPAVAGVAPQVTVGAR